MSSEPPSGPEGSYGPAQPGPWGPPPGAAGYGYQPPPPSHPSASTALVLGVLGLVLCQVLGPFAWAKGNEVIRQIDAEPGRWSGRDQAQVGRVLGIVSTVLLALAVVVVGVALVAFIGLAGAVSQQGF